jgi:hypothetical protein
VLAVAVASPCTAPFMGASLGLAATLPPAQALAIFARAGPGDGAALPAGQRVAGAGAARCRARAVDGALQDADGLPDVRHRGLAGRGCWASRRASTRVAACWACCWRWRCWPGRGAQPTLAADARGRF